MQRRSVLLSGVSAAVSTTLAVGRTTRAQDATPAAMASHPIVGAWIVDRAPADPADMPTTNIFTADGGLIDPSVGAAGAWTATGPDTADFTLIAIFAEGGGSYFIVRGSITVDADGNTATNTSVGTHVAADGTVLESLLPGTGTYIRLRVEPQSAAGQPFAGFPAWAPAPPATPTA